MPSVKNYHDDNIRKIVWLAVLIAIGLIIFLFETYIPRPLPWLKPGLANMTTLLALYLFGVEAALIVVAGRVFLGTLIMGTFLNPAFILAMGGGILAILAMATAKKIGPQLFSIFGISIIGAITHNIAQLILVEFIIVKQIEIFYLLPILILSALFTGMIVAFISHYLLENINKNLIL